MQDLSGRLEEIANELSQTNTTNDKFQEQIKDLQFRITSNQEEQKRLEKEARERYSELLGNSLFSLFKI